MITNRMLDIYTVTIELLPEPAPEVQFRAVAEQENKTDALEAVLSENQMRDLLMHAYGGEQTIVDQLCADVHSGEPIKLHATAKDPLILTSNELIRFGFNPDDFNLSQCS